MSVGGMTDSFLVILHPFPILQSHAGYRWGANSQCYPSNGFCLSCYTCPHHWRLQCLPGRSLCYIFSGKMCVSVSKNDQTLAKLEPWTAVSAYLGLISKVQSSAGAGGQLHTYNKVHSSSLVGQVYQWSLHWLCSNHGKQEPQAR